MGKKLAYLVIVILLLSCHKPAGNEISGDVEDSKKTERQKINEEEYKQIMMDFVKSPFEAIDLLQRDSIVENFGQPLSEKITKNDNILFKEQFENVIEYDFDGMSIFLRSNTKFDINNTYFLVQINSVKHKLKYGISVGMSKDEIIALLGSPDRENEENLMYTNKEVWYSVTFWIENNIVKKISWLRDL